MLSERRERGTTVRSPPEKTIHELTLRW